MRAWGQAFRIPTAGRGRAQASIRMSCQPIAGYKREIFSAGCTMNIGLKKLLREVASTFSGAQVLFSMPPKKQDFGGVLAQFVDSEGAHCSVGEEGIVVEAVSCYIRRDVVCDE